MGIAVGDYVLLKQEAINNYRKGLFNTATSYKVFDICEYGCCVALRPDNDINQDFYYFDIVEGVRKGKEPEWE
jgi:hypothetical protein